MTAPRPVGREYSHRVESDPKFIVFENVLINVADISWSGVDSEAQGYGPDPDKPWSMTVNFRGVSQFVRFDFETHENAKTAHFRLIQLIERVYREQ